VRAARPGSVDNQQFAQPNQGDQGALYLPIRDMRLARNRAHRRPGIIPALVGVVGNRQQDQARR
jgi:hypothetical protein